MMEMSDICRRLRGRLAAWAGGPVTAVGGPLAGLGGSAGEMGPAGDRWALGGPPAGEKALGGWVGQDWPDGRPAGR
jgi:hypothetical protein